MSNDMKTLIELISVLVIIGCTILTGCGTTTYERVDSMTINKQVMVNHGAATVSKGDVDSTISGGAIEASVPSETVSELAGVTPTGAAVDVLPEVLDALTATNTTEEAESSYATDI